MTELYRVLSKQRSVSLYEDQEDKIAELIDKGANKKILQILVRRGIDLALQEYEQAMNTNKEDK